MNKAIIILLSIALAVAVSPAANAAEVETSYAIKPQFEAAGNFHSGVAAVKKDGKWGLINKAGKLIVKPQYDSILYSGDLPSVEMNGKWGLIDRTGKVLVKPQYDSSIIFVEKLAKVGKDNLHGFIDMTGKVVIPLQYSKVYDFKEGLARVEKNGQSGFINRTGREAIKLQYATVDIFDPPSYSEGRAAITVFRNDGDWDVGFIDKTGNKVVEPRYWRVGSFSEGLAWVANLENHIAKVGFINESGREIVAPQYSSAGNFREGFSLVSKQIPRTNQYNYGFIDKAGNEVVALKYENGFDFSEGLAGIIREGKLGFVDRTGREVIRPQYEYDRSNGYKPEFIKGLARVGKRGDDGWVFGVIDKTGKEVVNLRYSSVGLFNEGLAQVREVGSGYGFVTASGVEIVKPQFGNVGDFSEGLAAVYTSGKWGYIANPLTEKIKAAPANSSVMIDGKKVAFEVYTIRNNNYLKLRDVAMALNASGKQFEVSWDGAASAIALTSGKAYTAVGGELVVSAKVTGKEAKRTAAKIILDGEEVALTAYAIGNSNYFKLRDIGKALNFGVVWDPATQTISVDTSSNYVE